MSGSTDPGFTDVPKGAEALTEIKEEWVPFLETYEEALRHGDTRPPEQWLSDHPQLPKGLHDGLEQLYWLYDSGERAPALSAVSQSPLPSTPDYTALELLGRGGMGVVYKAWQKSLKRVVALKMIRDGALADEEARQRFRREAEAAAHLRHPHIVQVYEVGELDGRPFFALEHVGGGSLAQKVRGTPQPPGAAARLVETLARAISHAHQQGIVHRDLKPSNVLLLGEADAPLGQCVPKITDFGLAKQMNLFTAGAGPQTQSGAIVGTAEYMSPEQAAGQSRAVGPAADIYSLGAILYELLTGRPPFKGASLVDTLQQVLRDEPVSPRSLQPKVPRDLETICLKCLHKGPDKRYATAEGLAEDLRRFQAGEPIQARPVGTWERAVKWARRRPTAAALALVSALAALLFLSGAAWSNAALRAAAGREHAKAEEAEAQQALAAAHLQDALDMCERPLLEMNGADLAKAPELQQFRLDFLSDARTLYGKLLADLDNPNRQVRRGIGRAFHGRGTCHFLLNERAEALADYLEAVGRQEQLVRERPDEDDYLLDLAVTYHSLGALREALGDKTEATRCFESIARLFKSLPPGSRRVALFANTLAHKLWLSGKSQEALDWENRVIDWLGAGLRQGSLSDANRTVALPNAYFVRGGLLAELGRHKQAVEDFDRALAAGLGPPSDVPCRLTRAASLARLGDHKRAMAEVETLAANSQASPDVLCNLAGVCALSAEAVRRDTGLPSAQRDTLAERNGARAVALLAEANAAGFFKNPANRQELKNDPDLQALRTRDDFKKLLAEVEKQAQPVAK